MKKKTKVSKPAKKAAKKVVKKPAPKKPAKKVAPKKPAKAKPAKKNAIKKPAAKSAPKSPKAVVTTVLPPKLSASAKKPASSATPAQAAVKAPKAPQAKIAAPAEKSTRKRLNKDELKYFEKLLNEKKETMLQEQSYLEDNAMRLNSKDGAGDLSSHAYHLADHATETQDREQAFHLASREGKFLYYIEEALDRVRAGTFGICKKCGTLIPKARLEAVPTAKMCINCKSQQEHAVIEDAAVA
ncbi:MAG TPA: TraR/DksA C4-type zinc finger protein [Fibrobacteria bacterium]|nr:TraR/DksA C4-type zinc finger protein [Fibrobacteria bacterium]